MSDRYLWDGTGEPDPEVERLEGLLRPLQHSRPLSLPEVLPRPPRRRGAGTLLAAAAVLVAALGLVRVFLPLRPAWDVSSLTGAPRVGSRPIAGTEKMRVGEWLETDATSRARIRVGSIGEVEVEPMTRVGLVRASSSEHRLALTRGALQATVNAPPRLFLVETPSALAVDLGCAYRLEVDESGAGLLHVFRGFVALERGKAEALVPAGALCALRPGLGPGTPYFQDAAPELVAALARLDRGDPSDLASILTRARASDTLTLWHLLGRVNPAERDRLYERMDALVPPPDEVTRAAVLGLDPRALEAWRLRLEGHWRLPGDDVPFRKQKLLKGAKK